MKDSGGGSIVNISSIHEDFPFPSYLPDAAAKRGLGMLAGKGAPKQSADDMKRGAVAYATKVFGQAAADIHWPAGKRGGFTTFDGVAEAALLAWYGRTHLGLC